MADLEDLGYPSILNMPDAEAIDLLRQIRLSRRTPEKRTIPKTREKKLVVKKTKESIDGESAAKLLALLTGGSK